MSVSIIAQRFASYAVKLDNIAELSEFELAVKFTDLEKEYNREKRAENARFKNLSDEDKQSETERLKREKAEKRDEIKEKRKQLQRNKTKDEKAVEREEKSKKREERSNKKREELGEEEYDRLMEEKRLKMSELRAKRTKKATEEAAEEAAEEAVEEAVEEEEAAEEAVEEEEVAEEEAVEEVAEEEEAVEEADDIDSDDEILVPEPEPKKEKKEEKNKIKQTELIQQGIIVPFLPKEIDYAGCKALKLYPAKQGKREGLFLPCCAPPKENGFCVACLKSGNNYGCLDERLKSKGLYKSSNNKNEISYKDWFKDNKKHTYEDMRNKLKHIGVKLSIFEEKMRHRSPSISSDEGEDSISEIIKDGIVYHITNNNTIFNDDGELVGRIDEEGEPLWN